MRETMLLSIFQVLLSLIFFVMMQDTQAIKQSYIVYLGSHSFGSNPTSVDAESATNYHYDLLGSYVGSIEKAKEAIFYSYNRYINGFAAVLDEDEAANIAKHPNVVSVFLDKEHNLATTHSWNFLGMEEKGKIPKASIWQRSLGEDIIIGNIDTGVWPESKSFSDEGMGPAPTKWHGKCEVDKNNKDKFHCNRKLIGAKYFYKGYQAFGFHGKNVSYASARDFDGHGTHTLSTAGGNFVYGASVFGNGKGIASGGSPKARVASYKVCWSPSGCFGTDILAAFEAAIGDGVDVLSMSIVYNVTTPVNIFESGISIGSFHAVSHGVVVVSSGGNSGPSPNTVCNLEPWMLTVAASTIDREFSSDVTLGNMRILKGESLSQFSLTSGKLYPLVSAANVKAHNASDMDAIRCKNGTLDPKKSKGKILVCLRGDNARNNKGVQAAHAGAIGMILANNKSSGNEIIADPHVLPASHINFEDGSYIFNYIKHTKSPKAYISRVKTKLGVKPAPIMAAFSSRGPNLLEEAILKPDITAPGVNIVAAYSEAASPTEETSDERKIPFTSMSGTSMSCPHVSGIVGLLKSLHPNWSPAAIKSAIMTTASTKDKYGRPILNSSMNEATPFDYGAGHIQPNRAMDPGLVYDLNIYDYLNFLCVRGHTSSQLKVFYPKPYTCPKSFNIATDFNYPAITIPNLLFGHSVNVTRTLTNVGSPNKYRVHIKAPPHVLVSVEPRRLSFKEKGEKKEFRVTLTLTSPIKDYVFGRLVWKDGKHHVNTPITVKMTTKLPH
ncbi:subtilisin-like protease SBT5.4 [Lotus japonicus]|uniref:subtilisin-like protease SBT5.4 n=1 Tax=Lotus japonicus TaxID=34305 RepID=UPI00258D02CD|nr:subtilisin-like protease SBT5.4 [Lotus japonicus]